jgi:hypothetical protein
MRDKDLILFAVLATPVAIGVYITLILLGELVRSLL